MIRKMTRGTFLLPLLFTAFFTLSIAVGAQSNSASIRVSPPEVQQFPALTLYATVRNEQGFHIPNLNSRSFLALEDDNPIPILSASEITPGTRQIIVINTTRGLRGRDALGFTRYDYVREGLLDWWADEETARVGIDDLSLFSAEGSLVTHSSSSAALAAALDSFEPEFIEEDNGFDLLQEALDYTTDPSPRMGMANQIIFITPLIRTPQELPLPNTIARANASNTVINTILVGPEELLDFGESAELQLLADSTGGQFSLFDPVLGFAELENRVLSQRSVYELTFNSQAQVSGIHALQVQLVAPNQEALSPVQEYTIEIEPPSVAFIQPPETIQRQSEDTTLTIEELPPTSMDLEVLINFPDDHERQIVSSEWIIDGQTVLIDREAPFNSYTWNLSPILMSGRHTLQVVIRDSLGLEGSSIIVPVTVDVILPPSGLSALRPNLGTLLTAFGVITAVGLAIIAVARIGRRRSRGPAPNAVRPGQRAETRQRASLQSRAKISGVEATLEPQDAIGVRIRLTGSDMVLGRDPSLAAIPLEDPSVNGLHARVIRLASGEYQLRDQGSIAGSWVNYSEVNEGGVVLRHGDLVHIGLLAFRFLLHKTPPQREIRIRQPNENSSEESLVLQKDGESGQT
jgi:pSer/pThr/pTyr-binding forkhead associated (FHA) protein